jgi:hypothetical protein
MPFERIHHVACGKTSLKYIHLESNKMPYVGCPYAPKIPHLAFYAGLQINSETAPQ